MTINIKTRIPRLFISKISIGQFLLDLKNTHYLTHVMRGKIGDHVLVFDSETGEYLAQIETIDRKGCALKILEKVRDFVTQNGPALLFAPIKKPRLDFLIEKAVELGVGSLYPVITNHTINRHLNRDKIQEQVIQATEQCERLEVPPIHDPVDLERVLDEWDMSEPIFVCAERKVCLTLKEALHQFPLGKTFLVGPEGGFSSAEFDLMAQKPFIHFVNLGAEILRAETAAIMALSYFKLTKCFT